jgi:hypothetical protein
MPLAYCDASLYKHRLDSLEREEESLTSSKPTHHEYLAMKKCLDDRYSEKVRQIETEYELEVQALKDRAGAGHSMVWSHFYQQVRDQREQIQELLNEEWYRIQNARRSAHSLPEFSLSFPSNLVQRTRNAVAYNMEVSYLSGIAKNEGFPAAPELKGVNNSEMEDDFEAMQASRR